MNRIFNRLFNRISSNKGYTIDQTILIVAIIAILITLVIVTVGWQLINRTGGTKTASQLRQIEEAAGQFFSAHRVWPHLAYTGGVTATNNFLALQNALPGGSAFVSPPVDTTQLRNLLPGFSGATHSIGTGGAVTLQQATISGEKRLVVMFASVPYAEASEAEKNIDNDTASAANNIIGRIRITSNTCAAGAGTAATTGNVFLCYIANAVE